MYSRDANHKTTHALENILHTLGKETSKVTENRFTRVFIQVRFIRL